MKGRRKSFRSISEMPEIGDLRSIKNQLFFRLYNIIVILPFYFYTDLLWRTGKI